MSILILELIGLFCNNNVTYIDSFGVEHFLKEINVILLFNV